MRDDAEVLLELLELVLARYGIEGDGVSSRQTLDRLVREGEWLERTCGSLPDDILERPTSCAAVLDEVGETVKEFAELVLRVDELGLRDGTHLVLALDDEDPNNVALIGAALRDVLEVCVN